MNTARELGETCLIVETDCLDAINLLNNFNSVANQFAEIISDLETQRQVSAMLDGAYPKGGK